MSFLGIWLIFIINIVGELWQALLAGVVWAAVAFAIHFAAKSELRPIIRGEEHSSSAVRSAAQEMKLGVLGTWCTSARRLPDASIALRSPGVPPCAPPTAHRTHAAGSHGSPV